MRLPILLLAALTTLCSLALYAQPPAVRAPGSAGTATPQPYAPALPRVVPNAPLNQPPLLKQPQLPNANQKRSSDQDLPLLQQQRQRSAESLDKSRY